MIPVRTIKLVLTVILLSVALFLVLSCGKNKDEDAGPIGPGTVAVYITDNLSYYRQVIGNVRGVRLVNSGTQDVCTLLAGPVRLDLSNLALETQFVGVQDCEGAYYNRIDVLFDKAVHLMDLDGAVLQGWHAAFLDENGDVSALNCDPATDICTLSLRSITRQGAVMLPAGRIASLMLDFDLKQYSLVDLGDALNFDVTMKVTPLIADAENASVRSQGVTGVISGLDAAAKTFSLAAGSRVFVVDYSQVLPALQPGLDILLPAAEAIGLRIKVLTAAIDLQTDRIKAANVYAKAAGTLSGLSGNPARRRFTLTCPTAGGATGLEIETQPQSEIDGDLADGAWVQVRLSGAIDDDEFIASQVNVLEQGMTTDD